VARSSPNREMNQLDVKLLALHLFAGVEIA
jgi:hypothetical protein